MGAYSIETRGKCVRACPCGYKTGLEQGFDFAAAPLCDHCFSDDFRFSGQTKTLEQFASTLVHELNQPLTAASNYAHALAQLLHDVPGEVAELASKVKRQIIRADQVLRTMHRWATSDDVDRQLEDLGALIQQEVRDTNIDSPDRNLEINYVLPDRPVTAMVNQMQIRQVLANLIRNAAEAMSGMAKGEIRIVLSSTDTEAIISIADTGPGVSIHSAECLFDPFITNKPCGMGLGLTFSRKVVQEHGGSLYFDEAVEGAQVTIRLPLA